MSGTNPSKNKYHSEYNRMYKWDAEFKTTKAGSYAITGHITPPLKALKSCIEADEPLMLSELIGKNKNAYIYALMTCFTLIPSVNCIEYLVSIGTPLDRAFEDNPYGNISVIEYLDSKYGTSDKISLKIREKIIGAINNGKAKLRKYSCDEYTILYMK
jgi:hypothetical protein